jgi:hypothetical protein
MTPSVLSQEIEVEFAHLDQVVDELVDLREDTRGRAPALRETVAASGFLMQFYMGTENILKRISKFCEVPLPRGEHWHRELLNRFSPPGHAELPLLFDSWLAERLDLYRGFRHVTRSSYGVQLDWSRVVVGIDQLPETYRQLRSALEAYLGTLDSSRS